MNTAQQFITKDNYSGRYTYNTLSHTLKCEDCENHVKIPRSLEKEKLYILDRLDAKIFKGMKFINLDDEALPIAKEKRNLAFSVIYILPQNPSTINQKS